MKLLLVRHGETNANLQMRWSGYNDIKSTFLTERGKEQAKQLCSWLKKSALFPTHIYSSPQIRSKDTCNIATNFYNLPIRLTNDLRETNPGIFEGLTWEEIEKKYPDKSSAFVNSRNWTLITKSENDEERLERGKKIFNFLLSNHSNKDTVFIFSHGGIMRQIIAAILETKKLWNLSPKNTSLFEFSFDKENWDEKSNIFNPLKWQILKFNDTPHLSD